MCHREPQYAAWRPSERAGADWLGLDGWQSRVGAIRGWQFGSNVTLASFLDCFAEFILSEVEGPAMITFDGFRWFNERRPF